MREESKDWLVLVRKGLPDLFIAALQLSLDPLTSLLAPDLEVSVLCMM